VKEKFAVSLAKNISENTDLVTVWSGVASPAFKKAEQIGAIKILERGSTHPTFTKNILEEEYHLQGINGYSCSEVNNDQTEYQRADYIAIPSSFVKRTFIDAGFAPEKLIVCPYGVDLEEFPFQPKQHDPFRFLYVGALSIRKGVQYLLRAFAELNLPNSELWLLGSITEEIKPFMDKYAGHYRYFGVQPQKELYKYYNQCDAFCICSVEEGMAMVQLQAMACGLPIICTTNTGGEDLVIHGKSGFVIPIRDLDSLKEHMSTVFADLEFCKEMGKVSNRLAVEKFSWDHYGNQIHSSYRSLLDKKLGKKN